MFQVAPRSTVYDVVVIGSGAGGGTATKVLADLGVNVALLEAGPMIDPAKEFSKIAEVMSCNLDVSRLRIASPRSKPYGYLVVQEKVPRFKDYINGLDAETKRRIENIGY